MKEVKKCEYCGDSKVLLSGVRYYRGQEYIVDTVDIEGCYMSLRKDYKQEDDGIVEMCDIKINYCPMCGRKLDND